MTAAARKSEKWKGKTMKTEDAKARREGRAVEVGVGGGEWNQMVFEN